MKSELSARIDEQISRAREARKACETMLNAGVNPESAKYRAKYDEYQKALLHTDALRELLETKEREDDHEDFMSRGDTNAPIAEYAARTMPNDPTAGVLYARSFDAYLNRFSRNPDGYIDQNELRTLTIASDPDGGYTVPADRQARILQQLPALSPLLAKVRRPKTTRDEVLYVRVVPHPGSPDTYTSAFVGSMVGEITGGGDAAPEFGTLTIGIKKSRASVRFSRDIAADSEVDMSDFLMEDGAQNLALVRESQILVGTGVGNNCRGVLLDPDIPAGIDVSGTTANAISNTTADLGSVPKLLDLLYATPAQYRAGSFAWVMHPQTALAIHKLLDGDGSMMLGKLRAELPTIVLSEAMPVGGVDGNKVILAGPLDLIVSPERFLVTAQILLERYADTDEIALILRSRFGVGVLNPRAFRFGIV